MTAPTVCWPPWVPGSPRSSLLWALPIGGSVISTLGILTGSGADVSTAALGTLFTPVTAAGFLAFTLLYTPCVAAISAVKRELGSGWKAAGVALSQCVIAWMVAFLVYHIAALLLG